MDQQLQKWVLLSYVIAAGLLSYIVLELSRQVTGAYDLEAQIRQIDLYIRGGSVAIGAILFLYLYKSDRVNQFMAEVATELSRVTWPTATDTYRATIVVMVMVIIAGGFLGALDAFWTWVLQLIL